MNTAGAATGGGLLSAEDLADPTRAAGSSSSRECWSRCCRRGFDRVLIFVDRFAREHDLGRVVGADTGFLLSRDPDTVLAPDAAFVSSDRLPPPAERRPPELERRAETELVDLLGDRIGDQADVVVLTSHGLVGVARNASPSWATPVDPTTFSGGMAVAPLS